ncbi:MAG: protoporphyrinogen oxidase [Thermoplasmata archaeon]|nr:MAG: protoporphyrinogen oxidase [Thermoplasmata archaeon]
MTLKCAFHDGIRVLVCDGVYEPAEDTYLILDNLDEKGPGLALDVGTGSGIIAIWLAKLGFYVVATDIDINAIRCAKMNAELNEVNIDLIRCDLAEAVKGEFDVITFNPPYLPFKDNIHEDLWWYGGREIIERFINRDLPKVLKKDGRMYMVYSSLTGIKSPEEVFPQKYRVEIVCEKRIMFETLYLVKVTWK